MPVVEVSCPGCGAKLKAPDNMAGKKAKCKKCGKPFRIPGTPVGDSAGDPEALSALAMPVPPLPDDEPTEVMMAEPVEVETTLPLPAAPPPAAKPVSALPSADPFDFAQPAAPATPAKPAFGAARAAQSAPPPANAAPAPAAKPAAKPAKAATAAAPAKPVAKAAPAPLSLDDDDFQPIEPPPAAKPVPVPAAKAAPAPVAESAPSDDDPFAFSSGSEKTEKPAKSKRRDEDEPKPAKSKRRDEDEDEPKPAKSKRRDDEDEPPAKKRKKQDEDEDEKPVKSKAAPKAESGGGFNPFDDFGGEPEEPAKGDKNEKPTKAKRRDDDPDEKPKKKGKGDEGESEEDGTPRYRRPEPKGGMGKAILITGIIGMFALGLGIAAVVMFIKNNRKEPEQVKEDKKDEAPINPGNPGDPPKVDPKVDPKKPKDPDPKTPKDKDPDPKTPKDKDPDPNARPPFTVAKLKAFTVGPLAAAPKEADRPRAGALLETPLTAIRRVFPPFDPKSADTCVLIQSSAGVGGVGEKLALDSYSPTGSRVPAARIEYNSDGSASPIADLHASAKGVFFLAATAGKLHVWSVADKTKIADGLSPYADKPEHAKAGLAAAYFAADPNQVVTVSTAGAVLLYDLRTKKPVPGSEFIAPNGVPGKVAMGQSIAKADGNGSVVIAVAGVLYQLKATEGLEILRQHDLKGDVGRSLALSVSGTPGCLLYVFETAPDKSGKKEKVVFGLPAGEKAKEILYQFPATIGEPKASLWANGSMGGVVVDRGVLWFDADQGRFIPLVMTQPMAAAQYFGDEKYFWYAVPHPKEATKSVLVALSVPFDNLAAYEKSFPANLPLFTVKIDGTGLLK